MSRAVLAVFVFAARARAARATTRARCAAVVLSVAAGERDFRVINARRRIALVFHRTRIAGFAARAAHRAFAVLAAIRHSARIFFLAGFGNSSIFLFVHRAAHRRSLIRIIRFRVSERDDCHSEHEQRRQSDGKSFFHFGFSVI